MKQVGNTLIDLAALLNASRGVASKHFALRAKQWSFYAKPNLAVEAGQTYSNGVVTPKNLSGQEPTGSSQTENHGHALKDEQATEPLTAKSSDSGALAGRDRSIISEPFSKMEGSFSSKIVSTLRDKATERSMANESAGVGKQPPTASSIQPTVTDEQDSPRSGAAITTYAFSGPSKSARSDRIVDTAVSDGEINQPRLERRDTPRGHRAVPDAIRSPNDVQPNTEQSKSSTTLRPSQQYHLRESRVPATRLARLWNYSSLAAGMLAGAVGEGITRATYGRGVSVSSPATSSSSKPSAAPEAATSPTSSIWLSAANTERLVRRLSRMRGAALKLGQMISFQDAKLLPPALADVLTRVQDRADYMPAAQRDRVLADDLGPNWRDMFVSFDELPIAAASIGQVHRAVLKQSVAAVVSGSEEGRDGIPVAVKVQFPGVADSINSDLDNLSMILTASRLLPKGLYLDRTIANARTELAWECDYEREAACIVRYRQLFRDDPVFAVPEVFPKASGRRVLTMEFMEGVGITKLCGSLKSAPTASVGTGQEQPPMLTQEQRNWAGAQILQLCLREIAEFRFMQTDPNWSNFLYNGATGKLVLLDLGAAREYPAEFIDGYVRLLAAAARGDEAQVRGLSQQLGYLTGLESRAMVAAHVASVLTLAEPFALSAPEEYDFASQTITDRVRDLIPVMVRERLTPPPEETYSLHRKLSGAFLLCARLGSKVRCRQLFEDALRKSDIEGLLL